MALAEHVLVSPLHPNWVGFSPDEVDILKGMPVSSRRSCFFLPAQCRVPLHVRRSATFYPKRSYYGGPNYQCNRCQASFWWRERVKSKSAITKRRVVYNNCCKSRKVFIKPFEPPLFLATLLDYTGPPRSLGFIKQIRQYNCLFAFTSMGAKIDRSVNDGGGPIFLK